jgi:hypothetical protein
MKLLAAKSFNAVRVASSMILWNNLLVVSRGSFNESEIENAVGRSLKNGKQMRALRIVSVDLAICRVEI